MIDFGEDDANLVRELVLLYAGQDIEILLDGLMTVQTDEDKDMYYNLIIAAFINTVLKQDNMIKGSYH